MEEPNALFRKLFIWRWLCTTETKAPIYCMHCTFRRLHIWAEVCLLPMILIHKKWFAFMIWHSFSVVVLDMINSSCKNIFKNMKELKIHFSKDPSPPSYRLMSLIWVLRIHWGTELLRWLFTTGCFGCFMERVYLQLVALQWFLNNLGSHLTIPDAPDSVPCNKSTFCSESTSRKQK